MASPVSGVGSSSGSGDTTSTTSTTSATAQKDMFLQLLVAQIKNQDPLNPTDSTQFVSQLAQFSELEQVIAIRGDFDSQIAASSATGSATNGTTNTGDGSSS
jgi:flagellar basal-body rod modification protein FlgD